MTSENLLTWLDVQFVLDESRASGRLPLWLERYTVYQDDLVLEARPDTSTKEIDGFLKQTFGPRVLEGPKVALESTPALQRFLSVSIEEVDAQGIESSRKDSFLPSFRRIVALPDDGAHLTPAPPLCQSCPELVAFYSFKGGVGRTTHLLSYLQSLSQKAKRRALVIDADLEAPGITMLLARETSVPEPSFSFIDLLAIIQSDDSERYGESLDLAAYLTAKQVFPVATREGVVEHLFIPAFRSAEQAMRLDIRPEHVTSRPGKAWLITDVLVELGRRLEVDVILIDLRAGYSELASPLLFDTRIRRIIVTTPSSQSIDGTSSILRQLSKVSGALGWERSLDPTVVLSFVLPELMSSDFEDDLIGRLTRSYRVPQIADDETTLQVIITPFAQELLNFTSMSQAMERLESSALVKKMNELVEANSQDENFNLPDDINQLDSIRKQLSQLAEKLEYAESGKGDEFLRIAPLRALARQYTSIPPVAVVIGAKGSGKTYTYLQILRTKSWSSFVEQVTNSENRNDVLLWPILHSQNLTPLAQGFVDDARSRASTASTFVPSHSSVQVADAVRIALRKPDTDEVWWRHKWFEILATSVASIETADNGYAGELVKRLRDSGKQIVFMIDGLEDLFTNISTSKVEQTALRALIQGVPNYLREVPDNPLGILIFVRADLARSAVTQNYGQFVRLYDAFTLQWNEEEALRLAVWLARTSGVPSTSKSQKNPELMSTEEAKEALIPLWGPKLGSDRSREARSAEWVIAALSDFKGQIQARDLVRFLRHAAEESVGGTSQDRILVPAAIRNAIRPCGKAKIDESVQEIPQLSTIFSKLRGVHDLRIPFDALQANLTSEEVRFLQNVGMVAELNGEYYMPEIYRFGLGLRLSEGARPKVLSLARRAGASL